ncbi:TolC family protein [Alkalispirochaeta sphaeroplastigenens]|uniref:TolC family protein n=1 Tax=Alkalispirochaeta sphaeroplastigenens TaxID=1187066 RepID=UPI000CDA6CE1|nr:TolC family protein [Alkalispirochaeta sphaeroplastigenens]
MKWNLVRTPRLWGVALILAAGFFAAGESLSAQAAEALPETIRAGVVFDGPWEENDDLERRFTTAFSAALRRPVTVSPDHRIEGDWTVAGAARAITTLRQTPEDLDIVIVLGVLAGEAAITLDNASPRQVPVVAPFVLPQAVRGSGQADYTAIPPGIVAVELPLRVQEDVARIARLFPVEHVSILVPAPYMVLLDDLSETLQGLDYPSAEIVPIETHIDPDQVLLPPGSAAYVLPLPHAPAEEARALMGTLHARGIPTFAALGRSPHETATVGVLREYVQDIAATRAATEYREVINQGASLGRVQSLRARGMLLLDREALRQAGVSPRREALLQARFVRKEERFEGINLQEAVETALTHNLDLAARKAGLAAGDAGIAGARSNLLPQVNASTTFRILDEDRAESLFFPDQFSAVGALSFQQVLWSEPAWANLRIQELISSSQDFQYERFRQDTAEAVSLAYFDLLRTQALVELHQNDVDQLQFHLDRAQTRRQVGAAGPGDVYRFRSELALARRKLTDALSLEQQAQMQLNRLLNQHQRMDLHPRERGLEDPLEVLPTGSLFFEVTDLGALQRLEEELVRFAFDSSSEVQALNQAIAARTRERQMRSRSFWSPTVAMVGQVEHEYWSGGKDPSTPSDPLAAGLLNSLDMPGDTSWSIGIQASLPLYSGGQRRASLAKTDAELEELVKEAESVSRQIEQRLRSAFVRTIAVAESMLHAREANEAAAEALTLATRAYDAGVASAAELVDTQNRASAAGQLVQDATYEYLREFTRLLRALGATDAIHLPAREAEIRTLFETISQGETR